MTGSELEDVPYTSHISLKNHEIVPYFDIEKSYLSHIFFAFAGGRPAYSIAEAASKRSARLDHDQ